jgi:hypothetical protein
MKNPSVAARCSIALAGNHQRRRMRYERIAADAKRKTPFREGKGIAMTTMCNTKTMESRDGP